MSERIRGALFLLLLVGFVSMFLGAAPEPPVHNHAAMLAQQADTANDGGFWSNLLKTYVPRQQCMNNEGDVIWLNVISDLVIAISYYSIPIALVYFVRKRRDFTFHWLIIGFAAFILACGTTHVFNIIAIWHPVYRLDGIVKAITGGLSVMTAIVLWPLIPKALAVPSPAHLREVNEELRRANVAAQGANLAKSQFLANMSHEIRTPMSAIIGYTDLVMDPSQTVSDRLAYLNTIRRNGEHLLGIINGILDLSKIEAGKYTISPGPCSPSQILGDVASLMRVRAAEKELDFFARSEGAIPAAVTTDAISLRQILINLVGNAIKFTERGSVEVIMRVAESRGVPCLRFDVCDTGVGISSERQKRLFEPFSQGDDSMTRRYGGTGLGLAISKHLVELLGGDIQINSEVGRGTTFSFTVPTGPLDGVAHIRNWREGYVSGDQLDSSPRQHLRGRILLVEDWEVNRQLISIFMRQAGLEVAVAENGVIGCQKALDASAAGQPFDVILMDMQMPEMDGYEAAGLLRNKGYAGPIVALTAHAMSDDRDKCLRAGCTDYLSKPVRREDLLVMLGRYVRAEKGEGGRGDRDALIRSTAPAEIKPLLDSYMSDLPAKVAMLEKLSADWHSAEIVKIAHDLAGTGGMFGLMAISEAALHVESAIQQQKDVEVTRHAVRELINVIRSVEGYRQPARNE